MTDKLTYHQQKSRNSHWYWNPDLNRESFSDIDRTSEGWLRGRLPHDRWPIERVISYREKHKNNPYINKSQIEKEELINRLANQYRGHMAYTNGVDNIYLHPGQEIPNGFYRGCSWEKSELYWRTRKHASK